MQSERNLRVVSDIREALAFLGGTREVMARFGVTRQTVSYWRTRGRFPADLRMPVADALMAMGATADPRLFRQREVVSGSTPMLDQQYLRLQDEWNRRQLRGECCEDLRRQMLVTLLRPALKQVPVTRKVSDVLYDLSNIGQLIVMSPPTALKYRPRVEQLRAEVQKLVARPAPDGRFIDEFADMLCQALLHVCKWDWREGRWLDLARHLMPVIRGDFERALRDDLDVRRVP